MEILQTAMDAKTISTPEKTRPPSSSLWLWFYLILATLWAGISATSNGPTNHYTTILLLPSFLAASLNFFRYSRKTKGDQISGAIAYALITGWMIQNVFDLWILFLR
jgi:hypothetical protein